MSDFPTPTLFAAHGYYDLHGILSEAYEQATSGKGKERHAGDGKPFARQPIMDITARRGVGFPLGQIEKKTDEAEGMIRRGQYQAAIDEMRGVIIYAAAVILHCENEVEADKGEGGK